MTKKPEKRPAAEATAFDEKAKTEAAELLADDNESAEAKRETEKTVAEELSKTVKELAEINDRYLRLMAEYDNFRKRTNKERESTYSCAKSDTLEKVLPIYDNLERAANMPSLDEAYKKGVLMTFQQLKDIIKSLGVTEIETVGVQFDPTKHNAVMHVEDENLDKNVVAEVFQQGFEIDGKIVRCATVKVAN